MTLHTDRRQFLQTAGGGAGAIALSTLLAGEARSASPRPEPRAKRVLWLFMHGGPSHVDLFDPKPDLRRLAGKPVPESFGPVMTRRNVASNPLLGPIKPFRPVDNPAWRSATSYRTSPSAPTSCSCSAACTAIA